jgi:hypothetical protein
MWWITARERLWLERKGKVEALGGGRGSEVYRRGRSRWDGKGGLREEEERRKEKDPGPVKREI